MVRLEPPELAQEKRYLLPEVLTASGSVALAAWYSRGGERLIIGQKHDGQVISG